MGICVHGKHGFGLISEALLGLVVGALRVMDTCMYVMGRGG